MNHKIDLELNDE